MKRENSGLLRTLRPATPEGEAEFRAEARALGFAIDDDRDIGGFLSSLDATDPRGMAAMREAQKLLRRLMIFESGCSPQAAQAVGQWS